MTLALPNLDDRRWADLVEEARSLIPVYAPGWTDHNAHDPGMTLVDLLAWVTEADLYANDRIRDSHLRRFLALVGVHPANPRAANVPVRFAPVAVEEGSDSAISLPVETEVDATGRDPSVRVRTVAAIDVQPAAARGRARPRTLRTGRLHGAVGTGRLDRLFRPGPTNRRRPPPRS